MISSEQATFVQTSTLDPSWIMNSHCLKLFIICDANIIVKHGKLLWNLTSQKPSTTSIGLIWKSFLFWWGLISSGSLGWWCASVEYHVLFNNDRIWPITPQCGLRQGCPLSPNLYILCVEGLSSIIKNYELRGKLHGTYICWSEPPINHLDSLWCFSQLG